MSVQESSDTASHDITSHIASNGSHSGCPPHVLAAIYDKKPPGDKKSQYEESLRRWWTEYADRKNDETDEYVANSLLYDRNHLPRNAPAPDCVTAPTEPRQHPSN